MAFRHPNYFVTAALAAVLLTGCQQQVAEPTGTRGNATDPQAQTPPTEARTFASPVQKDVAMKDVADFVPAGGEIIDSQHGDLDGQGNDGVVLVINPAESGNEKPGEGGPRTVMLLVGNGSGTLTKVAENSRIVPCAECGGLAGDPYAYTRIEEGQFTISVSGGSRQRWSADYRFRYSDQSRDWYLQEATREAYDQVSEELISKTFTPENFGEVSFADFDPSMIKEVVLP